MTRKDFGKYFPLLFLKKMTKNYCKPPIDILLMKKIIKRMCLVLNNFVKFNRYTDQIIVLKMIPMSIIADHYYVSQDGNDY